jgi:hypothetical protein
MGCGASSQKDVDAGEPNGEVKALSTDVKTRFANVDAAVLGDYKEEAMARLAFKYGRLANIYVITTPPFHPAKHHHHSHAETHEKKGEEKEEAEEKKEETEEKKEGGGGEEEGEQQHADKAEAKEKTEEKPVKETRWTIFNDSKSAAKMESTFFHCESLRVAGSEDKVKLTHIGNGAVRASIDVPAGATVAFVEGPINGYMYKCAVHDPKTNTFELAASTE